MFQFEAFTKSCEKGTNEDECRNSIKSYYRYGSQLLLFWYEDDYKNCANKAYRCKAQHHNVNVQHLDCYWQEL
ncbi:CLUMA_CG017943, isoform A [Clunio marinus]|uniref:CLUMA_CG017943, isoform A n=1 Tax=Clunio marinus TaxID=568069 RepID=A0A1J1IZB9_9DIPT|nr:CLUMA_CG017943, isoform A [Clunio marinus]